MKSILIVDDEFGLADVIAELLSDASYKTAIAINGELGLKLLSEQPFDLVLLDVMMPILDGVGMLRAMRRDPYLQDTPVVLMTAIRNLIPDDDPPLHQAVLYKPFSPDALLEVIERLIGHSGSAGKPSG